MNLHEIPSGGKSTHRRKRLGRGEGNGHGKTCCRGYNGAKSRSGYSLAPGFEGGQMPMFRKMPKRGFSNFDFKTHYNLVNLGDLDLIETDAVIDKQFLLDNNFCRNEKAGLKVLAVGELTKAIKIKADKFSEAAKSKIEAAGGEAIINES